MKKRVLGLIAVVLMAQGCSTLVNDSPLAPVQAGDDQKRHDQPAKAAQPRSEQAQSQQQGDTTVSPQQPAEGQSKLDGELLYRLMLAEVAGQRGKLDLAVRHYIVAARLSRDAKIAERATRVAIYARDDTNAYGAANLWLSLDPKSIEAHQVLGALLVRLGQADDALEHFDYVLSHGRQDRQGQFSLIVSLLSKQRDKQIALEVMEKLVAKRQKNPLAHYAYSQLAFLVGQLGTAMSAIDKVLELRPDWSEAHMLRANIFTRKGQGDAAMEHLARALEEYPDSVRLRMFYARKLVDIKRYKQAREQFELVLEVRSDDLNALFALGLLGLQMKELTYAQDKFKQLLSNGGKIDESRYYLGQIAEMQERYEEAMGWYRKVRTGNYYIEAHIGIAVLLAKQDKLEQAREYLHSINAQNEADTLRLYLVEGDILRQAKRYEQAFDMYTEVLKDMLENTQLLYARALIAEKLNRLQVAEQDLMTIIQREPNNAQALNALGYTLADRNYRLDDALKYIMRAYKINPNDAAIIDSLGWLQYRMGDHKEALKNLRHAFKLQNDPEIAAHLGEVLWVTGEKQNARMVWEEALNSSPKHEILLQVIQRFAQ